MLNDKYDELEEFQSVSNCEYIIHHYSMKADIAVFNLILNFRVPSLNCYIGTYHRR